MRTLKITGYQAYGTRSPDCYFVDVSYRGSVLKRYEGFNAFENALRYVAKHGDRAIIAMGDRA